MGIVKAGALLAGIICSGIFAASTVMARPLTPAEQQYLPYTGKVPGCSEAWVLARIQKRFRQKERKYWHTGREISGFYRVRQIGFRSNGPDFIPRRYCTAKAIFNSGRKRLVSYWIGEDLGMAGKGWALELPPFSWVFGHSWGVEWCVHGLDYDLGFGANCQAARP